MPRAGNLRLRPMGLFWMERRPVPRVAYGGHLRGGLLVLGTPGQERGQGGHPGQVGGGEGAHQLAVGDH